MGPSQTVDKSRYTRGNGFYANLSAFRRAQEALSHGGSVILYGPRHFGLEALALSALERAVDSSTQKFVVRLDANAADPAGELDFPTLWSELKSQLGIKSRATVASRLDFVDRTRKELAKCDKCLVVFLLLGGNRDSAARFRDLIETIHQIVDDPESGRLGGSLFIAIDDYLLHYHVQTSELRSEWYRARWIEVRHLTCSEIKENVAEMLEEPADAAGFKSAVVAGQLFELTGGHLGLIQDLLEWVRGQGSAIDTLTDARFGSQASQHVENSTVLQWIRQAIDDDTLGLCATAIEHRLPKMPAEYRSPRIQILRQLGILVWDNTFEARLCSGPLGKMVEAIAAKRAQPKLGTIASVEGTMRYEGEPFTLDDDDICVLHLSDLHFGPDFGYRLRVGGRDINEGSLDVAALIERDLSSQKLSGRIDAVVISGDVTCTGVSEEYNRAAEAIDGLLRTLGVDSSRLVVVPGNHDLHWNPGPYAKREGARNVSKEEFDNFFSRICMRKSESADLVKFLSRGGKASLAIVSLDSNEVESEDAAGIGFVGEDSIRMATQLIRGLVPDGHAPYLWFVLHHHLTPVTSASVGDARRKSVSVLANAPAVLSLVRDFGAEVVLHGHEHQPSVTELKWWLGERNSTFGRVASICAGSLSAKRERLGPVSRNQYMILVRRPSELIVRSRIMGDEGITFQTHADIAVPLVSVRRNAPKT